MKSIGKYFLFLLIIFRNELSVSSELKIRTFEEQSNAKQLIKINEIPGLSIETIKKNVQAHYQTQEDIVIEPVLEGVANTVFLIKTDSKPLCVLKSFSYKSFSEVEDMCHVTERLRESDFPIPKVDCVIPTTSERGIMFMQHTVGTHKEIGEKERRFILMINRERQLDY